MEVPKMENTLSSTEFLFGSQDDGDKKDASSPLSSTDFLFGDEPKSEPYEGVTNNRQDKLKKDDLLRPENIQVVRNYMGQRYGRDALKGTNDEIVEGFVDSMRWFNTNVASTITEARRIKNADTEQRDSAGQAYELYDRLGNVFVNDGFMGAVDGVKDYVFAAAADPSNYLGLLTGGAGKAAAVGASAAGKQMVKSMAQKAGQDAIQRGLSKTAQQEAVDKAVATTSAQLTKRAIREPARKKLLKEAGKREAELFEYKIKRRAEERFMQDRIKGAAKKSVVATTAADATVAVLQDIQIQNTMMDVGVQEEYSLLQTGFSSLLGGVGGAAQLAAMNLPVKSGMAGIAADIDIGKMSQAATRDISLALDKTETKQATAAVMDAAKSWKEKVARGKKLYDDMPTAVDLIESIMFGEDKKGGLVKVYKDKGVQLPQDMRVTDLMTNLVQYMSKGELNSINKEISSLGISLGETTQVATNLGDLIASQTSKAGQVLNVMSQVRRTIDGGVYRGEQMLKEQTEDAMEALPDKADYGRYMQGLWRRMLVSSPATSAINVAGFAQFYGGTAVAEILTGGQLLAAGMIKGGNKTEAGKETLRQAAVYKDMVTQKLRYLADPYATKDAYMKILEDHDSVRKTLYESLTGGVDLNAERYGIDKTAPLFKGLEAVANGSSIIAGVRAQDTLTKSVMFMSELDKQTRLKHKQPLNEVLRGGKMELLDDDIMGKTLDAVQKSVFSKDYTKGQSSVIEGAAKTVEAISNAPLIGTILPFGRFFNNVLASSYQWTAGGVIGPMSSLMKRNAGLEDVEAFSRSTVGLTFMAMSMQYDEERRKDNLGTFDVKVGDTIINAQNTFPMSLFLAAGRLLNDKQQGRPVSGDVWISTLEQLAVGQLASDIEFSNDIRALGESIFAEDGDASKAMLDGLYKKVGNFAAGFTRPLDAANKMVGLVANNDAAKDVRQVRGMPILTQSATKYTDNIIEALLGESESITGETLRVATREGDIRDPNPFLSAIGIKIREGRTAGEELLDKLDLPRYKANSRTEIAAYDKAFNEQVEPLLNRYAEDLLTDPAFRKLPINDQKQVWKTRFSMAKKDMREYLENAPTASHIDAIRRKASAVPKVHKQAAIKYLKEEEGFDGDVRSMSYPELQAFFTYVDFHKESIDWK
tara:strand:- start:377 stop:3847 length:3471 start_codon:yes stop_codon:yes gene_type:complete